MARTQKKPLTATRIANFNPDKEDFLWDTEAPHLAVRARPGGRKSFIFQSTLRYKTIRIVIGPCDTFDLEEARETARMYQRAVDMGADPREVLRMQAEQEEREAEEAAAAEAAEREAAERMATPALVVWQAYVVARKAKWSERHLADHETVVKEGGAIRTRGKRPGESDKTLPGCLRGLLSLPLVQIDAERVRTWLAEEAEKRPTHARLAFGLLRAFLNWAHERPEYQGQVHADACVSRMAREELPKKAAKDDCLQREQLNAWFVAVRALENPVQSAYLQVALLTGARREELAGLRWEDVDFRWRSLTIRDKVEGQRTIPLTPYVYELLRDLKRRNDTPPPSHRILNGKRIEIDIESWKPAPWVFFSPTAKRGRLAEPRHPHNKALAAAGLPALSIHGLRRSFGTLAEWVECPVGVVAQIQGHKPSAIAEKHYRRRPLDLLRLWHTRIECWILEQAGLAQPSEAEQPTIKVAASS